MQFRYPSFATRSWLLSICNALNAIFIKQILNFTIFKSKISADNYFITDQNTVYFLTFTVTGWVDARLTGRAGFHPKRIQI